MNKFEGTSNKRMEAMTILVQTCLTCDMFNEETETCSKYAVRPPARVIAYGCEHYVEDIPF